MVSYTNGNGVQVQWVYNLRNLPTTITYPGPLNVIRGYDNAGRWTYLMGAYPCADGFIGVQGSGRGDGMGPRAPGTPVPTNAPNIDRPHLMVFTHCENVLMRDVFLTRSAYHCVRILECKHVRFDGPIIAVRFPLAVLH